MLGESMEKIQMKGPQRQKQIKEQNKKKIKKKEWASSVGLCQKYKPQHPHHMKASPRGPNGKQGSSIQQQLKTHYVYAS